MKKIRFNTNKATNKFNSLLEKIKIKELGLQFLSSFGTKKRPQVTFYDLETPFIRKLTSKASF